MVVAADYGSRQDDPRAHLQAHNFLAIFCLRFLNGSGGTEFTHKVQNSGPVKRECTSRSAAGNTYGGTLLAEQIAAGRLDSR